MITIEQAQLDKLSQAELDRMYALMIYAYEVTEVEIWGENYIRMDLDEYKELIENGAIQLARLDGEIVGSIATNHLDDESFGFGLLNADFSKKGLGIGRKLISASENYARENGAKFMKIEILRPSNIEVPQKKMLHDWYTKLGYVFEESMSFEERKPDKAEKALKLVGPTQFDCYCKRL